MNRRVGPHNESGFSESYHFQELQLPALLKAWVLLGY